MTWNTQIRKISFHYHSVFSTYVVFLNMFIYFNWRLTTLHMLYFNDILEGYRQVYYYFSSFWSNWHQLSFVSVLKNYKTPYCSHNFYTSISNSFAKIIITSIFLTKFVFPVWSKYALIYQTITLDWRKKKHN